MWSPLRSVRTTPPPAFTDYSGQRDKLGELSENVFRLMLQAPDERVREATVDLLDALTPPGKPVSLSEHALCLLFEQFAVGLQSLIAAPGMLIDELVGETVHGSKVLSAAVRVLLKHAAALAMSQATAPLSLLHAQACACALAFCPDTNKHPSLGKNCGLPLFNAAATPDE
ncbi:hypothetical protein E3T28_09240 [Cryobacterium sinapicolor]|uniref:Uncharacterized protein n=1 Tax=Cryobacterium sinapicolor TaxID=1259236 RepID=A0ABY2J3A1_9MICO|nr:hypothetical protein [Cryobacterium sinapicolor]TFC99407.1 hypothetical protein E3T28_09240 [Cryobacterium sinapicolor]